MFVFQIRFRFCITLWLSSLCTTTVQIFLTFRILWVQVLYLTPKLFLDSLIYYLSISIWPLIHLIIITSSFSSTSEISELIGWNTFAAVNSTECEIAYAYHVFIFTWMVIIILLTNSRTSSQIHTTNVRRMYWVTTVIKFHGPVWHVTKTTIVDLLAPSFKQIC